MSAREGLRFTITRRVRPNNAVDFEALAKDYPALKDPTKVSAWLRAMRGSCYFVCAIIGQRAPVPMRSLLPIGRQGFTCADFSLGRDGGRAACSNMLSVRWNRERQADSWRRVPRLSPS